MATPCPMNRYPKLLSAQGRVAPTLFLLLLLRILVLMLMLMFVLQQQPVEEELARVSLDENDRGDNDRESTESASRESDKSAAPAPNAAQNFFTNLCA